MTTIPNIMTPEPWIGLVCLKGSPENKILDGCKGAYSNFITLASSAKQFKDSAICIAGELDLQCEDILWAEPLNRRKKRFDIDAYLLDKSNGLSPDCEGIFGKFHTWEETGNEEY